MTAAGFALALAALTYAATMRRQRNHALAAQEDSEAENAMLRDARAAANKAAFDKLGRTR